HHGGDDLIVRILEHHTGFLADLPDIIALCRVHMIHPHGSLRGDQQSVHMLGQGRFPAAVVAQHSNKLPRLDIQAGQFITVLGHNGSGKSTLAKHMNALLVPTEGTMWVDHMDTAQSDDIWKIRQEAGMVFQNPDNQIIATVVEEDVGFGPENLGVPTDEIWRRVDESLQATGMVAYRKQSPNKPSGGQKQRVAIAGVMAMKRKCIILDEPTAMLEPNGRKEVLKAVRELNQAEGVTVI